MDPIRERCLSKLTNLRKVSSSPWCSEEYMGERLRGSKVIYHRKEVSTNNRYKFAAIFVVFPGFFLNKL